MIPGGTQLFLLAGWALSDQPCNFFVFKFHEAIAHYPTAWMGSLSILPIAAQKPT